VEEDYGGGQNSHRAVAPVRKKKKRTEDKLMIRSIHPTIQPSILPHIHPFTSSAIHLTIHQSTHPSPLPDRISGSVNLLFNGK
jgi:hypothetical protein